MKQEKFEKYFFQVIIFIGIGLRIFLWRYHFTHYDDIGIATSYLWNETKSYSIMNGGPIGFLWEWGWTYAPLQPLFTVSLLSNSYSYTLNLLLGRLPSLIIGIANIFLIYIVYTLLIEKKKDLKIFSIYAMMITSFSWENIIYSVQMEPYEIVVFGSLVLIGIKLLEQKINISSLIKVGVIGVLCYSHYQIFILVFAFYLEEYIYAYKIKNWKMLKLSIRDSILNLIISLPLIIKVVTSGLLNRGTNWNVGLSGEFLFKIDNNNIIHIIEYIISFFVNNIYLVFKNFFFSNSSNNLSNISTILLIILFVIGIVQLHYVSKRLAIFFDISYSVIFILIFMGKQTLSPSRHLLFIFPFLNIAICVGLQKIMEVKYFMKYKKRVINTYIIMVFLIFIFQIKPELVKRYNYIQEEDIKAVVQKYDVDYICSYGYWFNLQLFKIPGYTDKSIDPLGEYSYKEKCVDDNIHKTRVMLISGGTELKEENLDKIKNHILQESILISNSNELDSWKLIYKDEFIVSRNIEYSDDFGTGDGGRRIYVFEIE